VLAGPPRKILTESRAALIEALRTTDPVLLSYAEALLAGEGVRAVVLDTHMSAILGSAPFVPRRLMIDDDDAPTARRVLEEAGIEHRLRK
jgi:hypothetical protein